MPTRSLLNLALGLLVAGLAALLWFGTAPGANRGMADIDPATIDRIRIRRHGGTDLTFARGDSGWRITTGPGLGARPARIQAMLELPQSPVGDRLPAATADLPGLGLQPPQLTLRLGDHDFAFGGTDPIDDHRYILYRNTVHLLEDRLYPQLVQGTAFFTALGLLPAGFEPLRLRLPGRELATDDTAAMGLLNQWRQARAQQVLADQGGEATGEVVVQSEEGRIRYSIKPVTGGLALARPDAGIRYLLDTDTATGLGLGEFAGE